MSQSEMVLEAWPRLPQAVRDVTAPIESEEQYQKALQLLEVVWDQVGEQADHPLGSLFVLLGMNPPDRTTGQDTSPQSAVTLTAP